MTRWKGLLALAVAVSITGNVTHALLVAPTIYGWGAAISSSIAPTFLFWHTHNLITAPSGRRGDWVGVAVITAIALGAFAVSFMGLRELLTTFGFAPAIAVILPLVVDVTIAGASWELVREERAVIPFEPTLIPVDQPETDQSITGSDQAITAPIATDHTIDLPEITAGPEVDRSPVTADQETDQPQGATVAGLSVSDTPAGATDLPEVPVDPPTDLQEIAALIAATGRTTQPVEVIAEVLAARGKRLGLKAAGARAAEAAGLTKPLSQAAVSQIETLRDAVAPTLEGALT